jgi:hypothetical protein
VLADITYPYGDGMDEWEEYEREQQEIAEHVQNCKRDGYCYTCQSL